MQNECVRLGLATADSTNVQWTS